MGFSNTPLLRPEGGNEPSVAIGSDGTLAITGLQVLSQAPFGTRLWTGPAGSTPVFRGVIEGSLSHPGETVIGGDDADVDVGSTGTLHAASLVFFFNRPARKAQLGIAAIRCSGVSLPSFDATGCAAQVIDNAGSDRPWISVDGQRVYIAYHDAFDSALIHVQRSDDDGLTWKSLPSPIVGQGGATAQSTFNNILGPLVADPTTHDIYQVWAAGQTGVLKGTTFTPNNIFVSRSSDLGQHWTASLVYSASPGSVEANEFPTVAVDPTTGKVYAAWSDPHTVLFAASTGHGKHWSPVVAAHIAPITTATFPWLAAYGGTVDLVYYGTMSDSRLDTSAVWNVYLATSSTDGSFFRQELVSNTPNHVGPICTVTQFECAAGRRNLLDLFKVAIDPTTGRATVVYVDDTMTTVSSSIKQFGYIPTCSEGQTTCPLPQLVLAQQQS